MVDPWTHPTLILAEHRLRTFNWDALAHYAHTHDVHTFPPLHDLLRTFIDSAREGHGLIIAALWDFYRPAPLTSLTMTLPANRSFASH